MQSRLHAALLQVYRRLPRRARVAAVHAMSPSFTCGTMCVVELDGDVLLVRHSYRRRWGLPGGLLQRGEDVLDGARREVREEVGVDVDVTGAPTVVVEPGSRRVDVVVPCRLADGTVRDAPEPTSPEILEARWFPAAALPAMDPDAAAAVEALVAARRWAASGSGEGAQRPG